MSQSKIIAKTLAYSSVVGGGVLLYDESGKQIGQLSLQGFGDPIRPINPETVAKAKAEYIAMCDRLTAAINAGQPEGQVKHYKRDEPYDVVASEALFQVSQPARGLSGEQRIIADGDPVTVYRNPEGMHFVRFPDEMTEPRFTKVTG